jgi:uncharacterized membrane protein
MPPSPRTRGLLLAIAVLAFLGFADSAYLTADHYFHLPLPCSVTHGCETVLTSPYSMVGPVPLAAFGVLYYLGVLGFALFLYTARTVSRTERSLLAAALVVGLLCSIGFEALQAFVIHALCLYCLGSAIDTLILAGLAVPLLSREL